jgi:hypothetical protein
MSFKVSFARLARLKGEQLFYLAPSQSRFECDR